MADDNRAILTIGGVEAEGGTVAGELLKRLVGAVRHIVVPVAAVDAGVSVRERFRPSDELQQRFRLRIGMPQAGSYALPLAVADERAQPELPTAEPIEGRLQE